MESALEKLTNIMEKVERNTSSKSSFYILLSKKSAKIRTQFNPLIELDAGKKYEMSLLNLETYFSFPNIDATNNHFRYTPYVYPDERSDDSDADRRIQQVGERWRNMDRCIHSRGVL